MRTDATIDRRQVKLPYISYGRGEWKARYKDFVVWNDQGTLRLCRVVGRIVYAPELGSKEQGTYSPAIRNHLMLVCLNPSHQSSFIRWVPPEEIVECYRPSDYVQQAKKHIDRLFSDAFISQKPNVIADEIEGGD